MIRTDWRGRAAWRGPRGRSNNPQDAGRGGAARLNDSKYQQPGAERGMSYWVHDLASRLGLPDHGSVYVTTNYAAHPERKPFVEEFGKSLDARHTCNQCQGPVSEPMQCCPWCGKTRLAHEGTSTFPQQCPRCHRVVKLADTV